MNNLRLITIILLLTLINIGVRAANGNSYQDTAFQRLYKEYAVLFYKEDKQSAEKLADIRKQLQEIHLKNDNLYGYFSLRLGEVFYDNDHKRSFDAIRKANLLFEEMKSRGVDYYFLVYEALGHVFQSRGSYRMAEKYYLDAYNSSGKADVFVQMRILLRLANIHMIHNPKEAQKWTKICEELSHDQPDYRQAYYVVESIITLSLNDADAFWKVYKQYLDLRKSHPEVDENGKYVMHILYHAFKGNYDIALKSLNTPSGELNEIERLDVRRLILQRMNNYPEALRTEVIRGTLIDSLRTDMLFNNLNEINAEIDVAKMETKAAHERQIWLVVALILLSLIVATLVWRYYTRRRMQKELINKNKELEIALDHAKESDRMKTAFIEHVSHEIRTPLNVITGFAQVITNPDYELEEEERKNMLNDIKYNTDEITNIVNELLDIADDESKEYYKRTDKISVNAFCHEALNVAEKKNKGRLKLLFRTDVNDDFVFNCHQEALKKILKHLLGNAIKFTNEGSVELYVHESPDHGIVRFIVSDTGIGIDEVYKDNIFNRFFKIDSFKPGFGLGLTVSYKMTKLLEGNLSLDTTYKNGARFILTLPA